MFRLRLSCLCYFIAVELATASFRWSAATAEEVSVRGAVFPDLASVVYPTSRMIVDVTRVPYHAKGDGITDDPDAIQQALVDVMEQHKMLYFPNGTYLISRTIRWSKKNSAGQEAWGHNSIQRQNARRTIIRLKDGTFTDPVYLALLRANIPVELHIFATGDHDFGVRQNERLPSSWPQLCLKWLTSNGLYTRKE